MILETYHQAKQKEALRSQFSNTESEDAEQNRRKYHRNHPTHFYQENLIDVNKDFDIVNSSKNPSSKKPNETFLSEVKKDSDIKSNKSRRRLSYQNTLNKYKSKDPTSQDDILPYKKRKIRPDLHQISMKYNENELLSKNKSNSESKMENQFQCNNNEGKYKFVTVFFYNDE